MYPAPGAVVGSCHLRGGRACRQSRIKRWVAIQGPFKGTPIADFIGNDPVLSGITGRLLTAAKGSLQGLTGMGTTTRQQYLATHKDEIAKLLEKTVCMGSSVSMDDLCATFLAPSLSLIQEKLGGGDNDGLVPVNSAFRAFGRVESLQALLCCCES